MIDFNLDNDIAIKYDDVDLIGSIIIRKYK